MSEGFREATHVERVGDGCYQASLPDQWQQGRGAFGGLVFGTLLRAARAFEDDDTRLLRTFACDVAGPVLPGSAELQVRALRRGKSQTNLRVELYQGGAVQASALCTLSSARPLAEDTEVRPRTPPPPEAARTDWRSVEPLPNLRVIGGPVFAQHYEYRNVGPLPWTGSAEPENAGFVRERAGSGPLDVPAICALLDAYWPAMFAIATRPGGMLSTTASFAAQFMHPEVELAADEPLFFRGRSIHQSHGFNLEFRELWAGDKLVALNQQTFVILR